MRMRQQYQPSTRLHKDYFVNQRGRGLSHFVGARAQRGHGIGGLFKSLGRALLPVLESVGKFISRELMSTGGRVISDLMEGRNIKESIRQRGKEAVERTVRGATEVIKR